MGRALLVLAFGSAACVDPGLVPCGDKLCPPGDRCVAGMLCASRDQLAACDGLADGATCTVSGGVGHCFGGACVLSGCGNCVVDPGEQCDDCNDIAGDGCSSDCKLESCGNGVLDSGEGCDDGNSNPADGCDACQLTTWSASAVIGDAATTSGTGVRLGNPSSVAVDPAGNVYIADTDNDRIRRIDPTGAVATVAGTGSPGFSGDGGRATEAQLRFPSGVAVDGIGNVYIADRSNQRVRKVDAAGTITTIAGTGAGGFSGDGFVATAAMLDDPSGVAVDGLGNVYIADTTNHCIRRVDAATQVITTVAGVGRNSGFSEGVATTAQLSSPSGVAVDGLDTLYIADSANRRIRRVDLAANMMSTVAGNGSAGSTGDGGSATSATLYEPRGVAIDQSGTLYIADSGGNRIRRVAGGTISTDVGIGTLGFSGDGGAAAVAELAAPQAVAADALGDLYIADASNQRIRRVTSGTITTVAGNGTSGDGGAATAVPLSPYSIAVDAAGNIYVADTYGERIRRIDASGVITTVAGTGVVGSSGDNGPAIAAHLFDPRSVVLDAAGNLIIADTGNQRVRRIDAAGIIKTIATAPPYQPMGVAVDGQGYIYVTDDAAPNVLRIDPTTNASTVVIGSGSVSAPWGVAADQANDIYVADTNLSEILRVDAATGLVTTVAGNGMRGGTGDGSSATAAELDFPQGVAVDDGGNLFIADTDNHSIRRVDAVTQYIETVAGNGGGGFSGDGGPPTGASLFIPSAAAVTTSALYIVDTGNYVIRKIAGGTITTIGGKIDPDGVGPLAQAHLADPRALAVDASRVFVAGGTSGTVELARFDTGWLGVIAGRYLQYVATGNLARYRDSTFGDVRGIAYDAMAGLIYLSESSANRIDVVAMTDPDPGKWTIATLAGDAQAGSPGYVDGDAASARFSAPTGLYLDTAANRLLVADTDNHVVRAIDLSNGQVSTIAGTPQTRGYYGDGGDAMKALLYGPRAVTRCGNDVFVADTGNNRVRRLAAGTITTVLGDGVAASSGEGAPAMTFPVDAPAGLACDAFGNLFVTSTTSVRMVVADDHGLVDGSGAVQTIYGGSAFPASVTRCLTGLAIVDATTVEVTDSCTGLLVALHRGPR